MIKLAFALFASGGLHRSLGTLPGVVLVDLMADKRVVASALGITMALSLMALAHPIERRLAQSAQG